MAHPSKELYHLAGDVPDPQGTGLRGKASTMRLDRNAFGHPWIVYKDSLIFADVYTVPNAPMWIHIVCPLCRRYLKIAQENFAFTYELDRPPKIASFLRDCGVDDDPHWGGSLSVERIKCTWETDPERRRHFGLGMCNWHVEIDNNTARDV